MKFGRNLIRNQVPEWSSYYINYKGLRKLIHAAIATSNSDGDVDLAEFLFHLDRNLEVVDSFYNRKFADACRRLKVLQERYSTSRLATSALDNGENDEVISVLLELRGQLRNLQWFGDVNRRGFVKITKKLDKKLPHTCTRKRYIEFKVNQKPFATDTELLSKIDEINQWISSIGEAKNFKKASSNYTESMQSLSPENIIHLPKEIFEIIDKLISENDFILLQQTMEKYITDFDTPEAQKILINLLQRAISNRSKQSIKYFLEKIRSLHESDGISQRNFLHRLVISTGQIESDKQNSKGMRQNSSNESTDNVRFITPALIPLSGPIFSKPIQSKQQILVNEYAILLDFVLENLMPHQRIALMSKDSYGRTPLHYAAQLEFSIISEIVIKYLQKWNLSSLDDNIDAVDARDNEGLTPLDISVNGGHTSTTKTLLDYEKWLSVSGDITALETKSSKLGRLISAATKSNFTSIVKLLIENDVDINWQDGAGETALHISARYGHSKCAEILITGNEKQKADLELAEHKFSWTPLHVACVDGHISVVELLIEKGANLTKLDASGWTAKEHAALRGHMTIAKRLADARPGFKEVNLETGFSESTSIMSSIESSRSLDSNSRLIEPIKTFGHRYLKNESLVLVNLGSMDARKNISAVKLEKIPIVVAHLTQLDTALSLYVSAESAQGEPVIIDLPINESFNTEPIVFTAINTAEVKIYFDVIPTYSGRQKDRLGRGVALLSNLKQAVGAKRIDLQRDLSVPIMSTDLEVIGVVNFNCLVITPFSHPNMSITAKQTYWKEMTTTMVIGHRGLGKNLTSNKSLQLGENTLQSFIAAANLGANYVEFDVQLTKDHIPVIYHDFLVSETGIDAPVHTLTLEQFLHLNDNTPSTQKMIIPSCDKSTSTSSELPRIACHRRSKSLSHSIPECTMPERMKHTRDFKLKGFKANSWGNFIQAPFTTLEEMFLKLPENVGFNIEMKYPMIHESEDHEMDQYAVELNSFVDTVLAKAYDLGKKRKIIFSSFNPEVCLLLSFKQPSIPILFLTDAGTSPVGDIRASSLQEAIRFASRWNLLGIVSAAEPLCNSPRLVKVIKESGLVCVSYGTLNNDPAKVQKQVDEGIDAVIVDSVLKIRNRLTKNAATTYPNCDLV
ncbi:Glycerophosphocholine phosphodiesterase GDE1 [Golovinomyces cichoracearum]|uniref:Glycerophosphocholine phosphodiesterase GDE1 n=1 Tax=Golovinomyces cichoracearum TaxID=62708 RepID=A0A420J832_9PEZI|nr:Glycerophosphocholine phosphodiesterase GDE1 [Golovinomyces cichoracearum]